MAEIEPTLQSGEGAEPQPSAGLADPEKRQRLLDRVRQVQEAPKEAEKVVFVWPHLLMIEFLAAVVFLVTLTVMAILINAPLEAHSNPDRTPNPSKAPWYFLNLQELLLHMHPSLAGVIVPGAALLALAAIPYLDRDTRDVGKWFGTPNAVPITIFTSIYTTVLVTVMILFDEFVGLKRVLTMLDEALGLVDVFANVWISGILLPTAIMLAPVGLLVLIVQRRWQANTREVMIALFTGFVVTYAVLTIVGTGFRGSGMHLYWPWAMPPRTH